MCPPIQVFEAHITIEPVFGEAWLEFGDICSKYKFRPAELLLQKNREATPIRSNKDSFCTSHGAVYDELYGRMEALSAELEMAGFAVWRKKIEGIVYDQRLNRERRKG